MSLFVRSKKGTRIKTLGEFRRDTRKSLNASARRVAKKLSGNGTKKFRKI